ncbi:MAG: cytochrome C oxidase subunit IV family protein [Thiovulaceae bacterium]|nr:cytochrome C oxidase subunit IV family protein [Sulfurimonadaceae bacterium]
MKYSIAIYTKVLFGLLLLTLLTFMQPVFYHMTPDKTAIVQLLISMMKIWLIGAIYMHLRSEKAYLKSYVLMALIILLIFFVIVGIDVTHL